jgi:hypothetical protein
MFSNFRLTSVPAVKQAGRRRCQVYGLNSESEDRMILIRLEKLEVSWLLFRQNVGM